MFSLIDWLSFGEGERVRLKLDVQDQGGRRIVDVDSQGWKWGGILKIGQFSWTSYMYDP